MKTLLELVTEYVAAHPGETLTVIARGVRARQQHVREVLSSDAFSESLRGAYHADRAVVYSIAPVAADGLGRAARRSQCDLVAAVIKDGEWHSTASIHRRCGASRLNSRVAELRKRRGMIIECRHIDGASRGADAYEYRLVGYQDGFGPSGETTGRPAPSVVSPDGPAVQHSPVADLLTDTGPSDTQLDLGEAA